MKYGIDLDGVCYDFITCFSEWLKNATGVQYEYEQLTDYYWHNVIEGLSEKDFFDEYHKFGHADMYRWLPLFNDTKKAIALLSAASEDLFFVTGRPGYTQKTTHFVIARDFGFGQGKLYYSGGHDYKSDAIRELDINVFVEDGPHYATSIVENTNAKVYLMDAPYNRKISHPRITRVYNWQDVLAAEGLINENSNHPVG